MTIAVVWEEDGFQWCAADTRLVIGHDDKRATEIAAKIYVIPVMLRAMLNESNPRQPYYWTRYGFIYAGATSPASMTAVTASTLLQNLTRPEGRAAPPTFEQVAEFVCRLSKRFMSERRQFGEEGIFSAAFFGWCPHEMIYKLAKIYGRNDASGFRVELTFPPPPQTDGDPWIILGSGAATFRSLLVEHRHIENHIAKRIPRRVVDKMVAEGPTERSGAPHPSVWRIITALNYFTRLSLSHRANLRRVEYSMDWIWIPRSDKSENTSWQSPASHRTEDRTHRPNNRVRCKGYDCPLFTRCRFSGGYRARPSNVSFGLTAR